MSDKKNIFDWTQEGMEEVTANEFAMQVQGIDALKLFARALPGWVNKTNTGIKIEVDSDPVMDGGVGISISFNKKSLPAKQANDLIDRLIKTNQLMDLERAIEVLKTHGADEGVINAMVDKANELAKQLHDELHNL